MKKWYVVAARGKTRIFHHGGSKTSFCLIAEFKNSQIQHSSKHLGRTQPGYHVYKNKHLSVESEEHTYLTRISDYLHLHALKNDFDTLIILAESHILHDLSKKLSSLVSKHLKTTSTENSSNTTNIKVVKYLKDISSHKVSIHPTRSERKL